MRVMPGYKQTEIGVIPKEWDVTRIGEMATVTAGGTPSRSVSGYWDGSIPWITTSEIEFNEIKNARQFITAEGLKNSAAKLLPPGTLLLALYGQGKTRGKVGILRFEAATNQACAAITLRGGIWTFAVLASLKPRDLRSFSAFASFVATRSRQLTWGQLLRPRWPGVIL